MSKENLKYRDLPFFLKRKIDSSLPNMQPRKSENPTVKHILTRLKASESRAILGDYKCTAISIRCIITIIESYLKENNFCIIKPYKQ